MKSEKQRELIDKYQKFFDHRADKKIYTGEKPVMEEVAELSKQEEMIIPIQFGFECGDGWFWLLNQLMGTIYSYCKWNDVEIPQVMQIKEKYGRLCFYISGGNDMINGMIWLAENMSRSICETCGSRINVGQTERWIYTICETCREGDSRAKELEWSPIT